MNIKGELKLFLHRYAAAHDQGKEDEEHEDDGGEQPDDDVGPVVGEPETKFVETGMAVAETAEGDVWSFFHDFFEKSREGTTFYAHTQEERQMLKGFQTNAKEWRAEKVARVVERR